MATFEILPASNGGSSSVVGYPEGTKMYLALLTQSGTDAPVATVLVNTLGGTLVWSRVNAGNYEGTLSGVFLETKTVILTPSIFNFLDSNSAGYGLARSTNNVVVLASYDGGSGADDILVNAPVQILVLP